MEPAALELAPPHRVGRLTRPHARWPSLPAACLHWGLIEGDGDARTYLDPLSLVGGGPVRLLPLWRDDPVTVRLPWSPPLASWRRPVEWVA